MIKATNLSKRFSSHPLFANLSFAFPSKGLVSINGGNGSGKTTLLFLLSLLDSHYEGSLLYQGEEIKEMSFSRKNEIRRSDILYLAPNGNFLSFNKIGDTLSLLGVKERSAFADRYPAEISGGQLQREELSLASANGKKVILIDEGISFLDEGKSEDALKYLLNLAKERLIVLASPRLLRIKSDVSLNMEDYDTKN